MVHFGIKSVPEVVAERQIVIQEKYTGRGASSRRVVLEIGRMAFSLGRCITGGPRPTIVVPEVRKKDRFVPSYGNPRAVQSVVMGHSCSLRTQEKTCF